MPLTDSDLQCCHERLTEILAMADQLVKLADQGDEHCRRDRCLVVYGVVRDSMWKIRTAIHACHEQDVACCRPEPADTRTEERNGKEGLKCCNAKRHA